MTKCQPERESILVAEDEGLLRLYAAGILEEHGYEAIEAKDAQAALAILEERDDIRLLFTDIQMPGPIDGIELARMVHERWPRILLIIASGREKPDRSQIPDDGRFLAKPYQENELIREVDNLMQKH